MSGIGNKLNDLKFGCVAKAFTQYRFDKRAQNTCATHIGFSKLNWRALAYCMFPKFKHDGEGVSIEDIVESPDDYVHECPIIINDLAAEMKIESIPGVDTVADSMPSMRFTLPR